MAMLGGDNGFTLVEVMISLAVFLVGGTALLPLLLTQMQANSDLRLHSRARGLAGAAMAEMQVVDYDRLGALTTVPLHENDIEVRRELDMSGLPDGQSRLTVSAHWRHRDQLHHYRLQTVRSAP